MKRTLIILSAVALLAACRHKNSVAPFLEYNDLSYTVINPDSVPTDGMYSWWTDSFKTQWADYGNEPMDDEWLYRIEPLGFRGDNYQRFYFHIDTVYKVNPTLYHLEGRTRCKEEICHVSGTITIDSVKKYDMLGENDFMLLEEEGLMYGHFDLEAMQDKPVAKLFGTVEYEYLIHNDTVYYDATMAVADGFCNNQYRGKWVNYSMNDTLICNWGDCRIPDSGYFDGGCGEFSPDPKYYDYGWKTYIDCMNHVWIGDPECEYYDSIYVADENWWK